VPNIIHAYRNTLGYVDQANSYRLCYHWFHHIFKHARAQFLAILGIAIINDWILYRASNKWLSNKKYTYCQFLHKLVDDLAQLGASSYRKRKRVSPKAKPAAKSQSQLDARGFHWQTNK